MSSRLLVWNILQFDEQGGQVLISQHEVPPKPHCSELNNFMHNWRKVAPDEWIPVVVTQEALRELEAWLSPEDTEEASRHTRSSSSGDFYISCEARPSAGEDSPHSTHHEGPIQGQGRYSGVVPWGAGVIGFLETVPGQPFSLVTHFCAVEKADGRRGFPKGERKAGESVPAAAAREWLEETGIDLTRLTFVEGFHVDDPHQGCRYLVAICSPPGSTAIDSWPQYDTATWAPPEDPDDRDPIVRTSWLSVAETVRRRNNVAESRITLKEKKRRLLRQALDEILQRRYGRRY